MTHALSWINEARKKSGKDPLTHADVYAHGQAHPLAVSAQAISKLDREFCTAAGVILNQSANGPQEFIPALAQAEKARTAYRAFSKADFPVLRS